MIKKIIKFFLKPFVPFSRRLVRKLAQSNDIDLRVGNIENKIVNIQRQSQKEDIQLVNSEFGLVLVKRGEIISDHLLSGNKWEPHILDLISEVGSKTGGLGIDVGGHIGYTTLAMAKYFKQVHVFEPNDYNFRLLQANVHLNGMKNITVHNNGLYSKETKLSIGTADQQEYGFKLNETGQFDGHSSVNLGAYAFTENGTGLSTHVARTLDNYNFENVTFIKIDVQGADGEVIFGGLETIKKWRPIVTFEWEGGLAKSFKADLVQIKSAFEVLGYEVTPLKIIRENQIDFVAVPNNSIFQKSNF